jgi:hypothetical protein
MKMQDGTNLLTLPPDKALRNRYFEPESFAHPAKMDLSFLLHLGRTYTSPGTHVVDPMGGIGSTLLLAMEQRDVTVMDIEERWIALAQRNAERIRAAAGFFAGRMSVMHHNAQQPWPVQADVVLFSPPYACLAAPNANTRFGILPRSLRKPGSMREGWNQFLARTRVAGGMHFFYGSAAGQIGHLRGQRYWEAMLQVYQCAYAALPPGGLMIVVLKDHIARGNRVPICDETVQRCAALNFALVDRRARKLTFFALWIRRRKERGEPVIEEEEALVFERR